MKSYSKLLNCPYTGFTLAEMMVVLLIISIILACMAPVMTTKMKADQNNIQTSPWKWARNNIDAYFSAGSNQAAMIGQNEKADSDSAKLIINNNTGLDDMILFKNGENVAGHLSFGNNSLLLGGGETLDTSISENSVAIGISSSALSSNSVSVGSNTSSSDGGIAIGYHADASDYATAIGSESSASVNGIAIGKSSNASDYSIVIGNGINNESENGVVIGHGASVTDTGGVAVGSGASAETSDTSIGAGATSKGGGSVAIGLDAEAGYDTSKYANAEGNSVAIGNGAKAIGEGSIAIGSGAKAPGYQYSTTYKANPSGNIAIGIDSMANSPDNGNIYYNVGVGMGALKANQGGYNVGIGYQSAYQNTTGNYNVAIGLEAMQQYTTGDYNIAIGPYALQGWDFSSGSHATTGSYNIGIGYSSCAYVKGSNKTCIGANSGPSGGKLIEASDTDKVIFLGDAGTTVYIPGNLVVGKRAFIGASLGDQGQGKRNCLFFNSERGWHGVFGYADSHDKDSWWIDMDQLQKGQVWNDLGKLDFSLDKFLSDRRLKYVGKENTDGLAKLRQLKIFNYTFKKDETKTPRVGVIAQDLQKVFPNAVKKGADGFLTIRMEDMFYAVINAIKELDARITRLEKENKLLKEQNKALDARLKAIEAKIK